MKTTSNRTKKFSKQVRGKHPAAINTSQKEPQEEHSDCPILAVLIDIIKQNSGKYSWSDVVGALAGIVGLATYCAISPALAKYRGTQIPLGAAWIALGAIILILIWELLCIIVNADREKAKELCRILRPHLKWIFLLLLFGSCVTFFLIVIINPPIKIEYYTDITEIYGVPAGVGEISEADLKDRAAYWKIEDHRWLKRLVLTYVEPYGQLEVMRENSSAYSMNLFPAAARIVCEYSTDQEAYRTMLDEATFTAADEAGILRTPVCLSYFSSSGKLLLQLEQNGFGRAKITAYSSDEMPQLLGSTLLRIPRATLLRDQTRDTRWSRTLTMTMSGV